MTCRYHDARLVCSATGLGYQTCGCGAGPETRVHRITVCGVCGEPPAAAMPGRHANYLQDGHTYQPVERDEPCGVAG